MGVDVVPEKGGETSSTDVGVLTRAKRRGLATRKEEEELLAASIEAKMQASESSRQALGLDTGDSRTSIALHKQLSQDLDVILEVATKSRNLKGNFVRALKDSAASIKAVTEIILGRTPSEEVVKLQAENARLEKRIDILRTEFAEFKKRTLSAHISSPPQMSAREDGGPLEELKASIQRMDARLAVIEDRLPPAKTLLPLLNADNKRAKAAEPRVTTLTPPANPGPEGGKTTKKKKKRKKTGAREQAVAPLEPHPPPPAPAALSEGWSVVARKGKKNGQPNQPKKLPKKHKAPKLRLPRSAAVQLKLLPGSTKTYAEVLGAIKADGVIAGMGVETRYKVSQTGARRLELPGTGNKEKAEELARRIKTIVGEDVAVTRPEKCADLRVSGLDDSVTPEELAGVIAKSGGCAADAIKVGEVRKNFAGVGTAWVRCPVEVAKKVVDERRLLVGFVSASVSLLKARPQQCYRCHEVGHVAAKCDKEGDRSGQCYRCGKEGHTRRQCTEEANCPACESANRPSRHSIVMCTRTKSGKKGKKATPGPKTQDPPTSRDGEVIITTI